MRGAQLWRGSWGPTFKPWGYRVPLLNIEGGPRVPRSRGPGSTFTSCPKKGGILLKGASKYHTTKHFQSLIIWQLLCNFTEIALTHGYSPVICCIFLEHLFLRTPLDGCFWLLIFIKQLQKCRLLLYYLLPIWLSPRYPAWKHLLKIYKCNKRTPPKIVPS